MMTALMYSIFGVILSKSRGADDELNTLAAGTLTGLLYKSSGGLDGKVLGGLCGEMCTLTGRFVQIFRLGGYRATLNSVKLSSLARYYFFRI